MAKLENQGVDQTEQTLKISNWVKVTLILFVVFCYGIYLIQIFRSALSYSLQYSEYITQVQALSSLFLFGKFGLIAFTIVESVILFSYQRSGLFRFKGFLYLLTSVVLGNLGIYFILSILYNYATSILG